MSKRDTRPAASRGITTVADIVQSEMKCGWQATDPLNDDAVDGLILDRRRGSDTGTIIFAQVKCGDGYYTETDKRPGFFGINVGSGYIETHKPRWNALSGPVIIIYVDFGTKKAWWANLKSTESFTEENKSIILISKSQRFGPHSIGHLRALRGYVDRDRKLHKITLETNHLITPRFSQTLKSAARKFYTDWSQDSQRQTNPALGRITISRVGWRHLTRRGRGHANVVQSLGLLGAAEKIVRENPNAHQLNRPTIVTSNQEKRIHEFLSLRSRVVFPNRQEAVVQVILLRQQTVSAAGDVKSEIWFYSIHEPRRAKLYGIESK